MSEGLVGLDRILQQIAENQESSLRLHRQHREAMALLVDTVTSLANRVYMLEHPLTQTGKGSAEDGGMKVPG